MRRRGLAASPAGVAWLVLFACAAWPARAAAADAGGVAVPAPAAPRIATTKVVYLAGGSVYVEAGRRDGIAEGDTLEVLRGARTIARLIVTAVSSRRAACDTFAVALAPGIGDPVRYTAAPAPAGTPASTAPVSLRPPSSEAEAGATPRADGTAAKPRRGARGRPWRGRVALRYLSVDPGAGGGYTQPALDVRADGRGAGATPLDLSVDLRSRRTYRGDRQEDVARVYRALVAVGAPGERRLTLGRQLSPALSAVSVFDGALFETAAHGRWRAGAFAGTQPEPVRYRPSGEIFEAGAFAEARATHGPRHSWTLTMGAVNSLAHGQVNRQFGFVNGFFVRPKLMLTGTQEIDLNTGWRRTMGDPALSFSSTFLSARAELLHGLTFSTGYDGRRSVRLWRDRLTPETEFDDAYRRGVWSGLSGEAFGHVRLTVDGRWNGSGSQRWRSQSASAELFSLPPFAARVRYRVTTYRNDVTRGALHAAGVGFDPLTLLHLEWNAGVRTSRDDFSESRTDWQSLDADLHLTRRAYLMMTAEWDRGDGFDARQAQAGLSWIF